LYIKYLITLQNKNIYLSFLIWSIPVESNFKTRSDAFVFILYEWCINFGSRSKQHVINQVAH